MTEAWYEILTNEREVALPTESDLRAEARTVHESRQMLEQEFFGFFLSSYTVPAARACGTPAAPNVNAASMGAKGPLYAL